MKRYIIPVCLMFLVFLGSAVLAIYQSYHKSQYIKDIAAHVGCVEDGGELIAQYDGVTTSVLGRNVDRLRKVLTVSDKDWIFGFNKPTYDEDEIITLEFSDGGKYLIIPDESVEDGVYVIYTYGHKQKIFRIEGYNSLSWVQKAISADGLYNANIVIE